MDFVNTFMYVYMYELEQFLIKNKDKISDISFQSDEANTDRQLKEFLKDLIEKQFYKIPNNSIIDIINIEDKNSFNSTDILKEIYIDKVLLPEEIKQDVKEILKKDKNSIYTNPDLCFKIVYNGETFYKTIELKSTKSNSIPGSSIQQVNPTEWVIFIKHNSSGISITTGQYINAINSKMEFPDRSPRPQVSFTELQDWNNSNRIFNNTVLTYHDDSINQSIKNKLICDWQQFLVDKWIEVLFDFSEPKNNAPWFNNTLRKFILEFTYKYDNLSKEEQDIYKENIKKIIK